MRLSLLVILATGLSLAAPATALGQSADPADVESIDAILTAVYDVISGEAGEARDWDRWHTHHGDPQVATPSPSPYEDPLLADPHDEANQEPRGHTA
jgi:hypothetical protein